MAERQQWGDICSRVNTCALTGAAAFFAGIPGAQMIANGPNWCYFYALRHIEKSDPSINTRFYSTQLNNTHIVYGTEELLLRTLRELKQAGKCPVMLVQNSCAVGLIGDDIAGIVKRAQMDCPVICLDSGGLIGGFCEGYALAGKSFLENIVINKVDRVRRKSVNLLGVTPSYYNGYNDLQELKRLLGLAGYQVIACPGAGSSVEEMAKIAQAELNIVLQPELGLEMAKFLESEYRMPFIAPMLPYGLDGTIKWLSAINDAIKTNLSFVEEELESAEQSIFSRVNEIKSIWGDLWFDKALISAPSSVAIGLARALRCEWADMEELTVVLQDDTQIAVDSEFADTLLWASRDSLRIEKTMLGLSNGLLLGSSSERSFLDRHGLTNVLFANIAYPVYDELLLTSTPFMGINGHKHMLERLWNKKIEQQMQAAAES